MRWDSVLALVLAAVAAVGTPFAIWSLVLAHRADRRSTEVRDIAWFAQLVDDEWTFTHSGSISARSVTIVFTVNDVASVTRETLVTVDTPVVVSNPEHTRLLTRAAEIDDEDRGQPTGGGSPSFYALPTASMRPAWEVQLSAVVTWTYPSGQADRQAWSWIVDY